MRVELSFPLSLAEICDFIGGTHLPSPDKEFYAVSTDTRELYEGDLFIALDGNNASGENFVSEARALGATAISKSKAHADIYVPNTSTALLNIAALYKSKLPMLKHTIAITGSVGKSTVKEFTKAMLKHQYNVHATYENHNNKIGVPLTVLSAPLDTEILILELGMNHLGEISELSTCIHPTLAAITNIGTAHIGNLGSRRKIAEAKLEICDGMESGVLIVPHNEPLLSCARDSKTFSLRDESSSYTLIQRGEDFTFVAEDNIHNHLQITLKPRHILENIALALSLSAEIGVKTETIKKGIREINSLNCRQRLIKLNGLTIFDDSYNSSIESIIADLEFMNLNFRGDCSALLGDILELGRESEKIHTEIGRQAFLHGLTKLYLYGDFAGCIANGAVNAGFDESHIYIIVGNDYVMQAAEAIKKYHSEGETVLIKASHRLRFDRIADIFEKEGIKND